MAKIELPKELSEFLLEKQREDCKITSTSAEDALAWIIEEQGLENWLTYIIWYEGSEEYELVDICGKAFDFLKKYFKDIVSFTVYAET